MKKQIRGLVRLLKQQKVVDDMWIQMGISRFQASLELYENGSLDDELIESNNVVNGKLASP